MADPDEGPFSEIPGGSEDPSLPLTFTPLPTSSSSTPSTISGFPTESSTGSLTISSTSQNLPQSTSTSSQPLPSSNPSWAFEVIHDILTCEPLVISWDIIRRTRVYALVDPETNLQLVLKGKTDPRTSLELAVAQPINNSPFIANNASVPVGTYFIQGNDSVTGSQVTSNNFQVISGPDTACLASSAGTPTSSSTRTSISMSTPVSSPSGAGLPGTGGSNSHSVAIAAASIVGGTVGGIAVLGLVVLGTIWLVVSRRRRRAERGAPRGRDGWNGLNSFESKASDAVKLPRRSNSIGASASLLNPIGDTANTMSVSRAGSVSNLSQSRAIPSPSWPLPESVPPLPIQTPPATIASRRSVDSSARVFSASPVPDGSMNASTRSRSQRKPVPVYEPTPEELAQLEAAQSRSGTPSTHSRKASFQALGRDTPTFLSSDHMSSGDSTLTMLSLNPHAQNMLRGLRSKSSGHLAGGEDDNSVHLIFPDPPIPPPGRN